MKHTYGSGLNISARGADRQVSLASLTHGFDQSPFYVSPDASMVTQERINEPKKTLESKVDETGSREETPKNVGKYAIGGTTIGAIAGALGPLIASYATGTHAEMKPIADKAGAIVTFTTAGGVVGLVIGTLSGALDPFIIRNVNRVKQYILNNKYYRKVMEH